MANSGSITSPQVFWKRMLIDRAIQSRGFYGFYGFYGLNCELVRTASQLRAVDQTPQFLRSRTPGTSVRRGVRSGRFKVAQSLVFFNQEPQEPQEPLESIESGTSIVLSAKCHGSSINSQGCVHPHSCDLCCRSAARQLFFAKNFCVENSFEVIRNRANGSSNG